MKLNDKIYHCRKRAGLSQEALAERIGVSRQAISKWETGEAAPEISKLPLLARTFGVTADWLLDDTADFDEDAPEADGTEADALQGGAEDVSSVKAAGASGGRPAYPDWIDHLPGFLGRMLKKYGWIFGLRIAIGGALMTAMGFVAKAMFSSMDASMLHYGTTHSNAGVTFFDEAGNMVDPASIRLTASDLNAMGLGGSPFGGASFGTSVSVTDPADIFSNFVIVIGLALLIGGAWLAWYLKKKGQESA